MELPKYQGEAYLGCGACLYCGTTVALSALAALDLWWCYTPAFIAT